MSIKFGTSGWRAIISEDFTFDNVRLLSQAIANYLKKTKLAKRGIMVAHDTRFLSKDFAKEAAKVVASNDIDVYLSPRATPTPAISFSIIRKKLAGAITISASHNPPEYNGFKFSCGYGGASPKGITKIIEREVTKISERDIRIDEKKAKRKIMSFNPAPEYLRKLEKMLDMKTLRKIRAKIAVDCMNGIATGYLDKFLKKLNCKLEVINEKEDPFFGGRSPDPSPENLKGLISKVKKDRFDLGLTVDGDGDRFGIIDKGGEFISPNKIIALIFYHLVNTRAKLPKVARSLSTTHLVDEIAKDYGVEVVQTPVGFKYIGELLISGECLFGAEESGGISIAGHVPEKDGILANLLVVEAKAFYKKSIKGILKDIYKKYGRFYNERIDLEIEETSKLRFMRKLSKNPPKRIAQSKVIKVNKIDGYKFILENGDWVMFRASGTEPMIRSYVESRTKKDFNNLINETKRMVSFAE